MGVWELGQIRLVPSTSSSLTVGLRNGEDREPKPLGPGHSLSFSDFKEGRVFVKVNKVWNEGDWDTEGSWSLHLSPRFFFRGSARQSTSPTDCMSGRGPLEDGVVVDAVAATGLRLKIPVKPGMQLLQELATKNRNEFKSSTLQFQFLQKDRDPGAAAAGRHVRRL